jgi:site-specific DNA-methyltransferase (adenine-specific)
MILVHGDALHLPRWIDARSAQLAYLDPPFCVGATFGSRVLPADAPKRTPRAERAAGQVAYDDRWESLDAYLAWLEARVACVRDLLEPRGTMWLHLDQRAVHEAKIVCDRVFGRASFVGEVIWVPGNGTKARRGPGLGHQTLLVYAAGKDFVWNSHDPMLREPHAKTSLSMHFTRTDAHGRAYRDRTVRGKTYRYYADQGRALGSVWTDCPAMVANTPLRKETTGYPTQKPLRLLERIVRASSEPGALVIDPFCGSGTTLEAAAMLGRRFAGSDVGALAIETTTRRLASRGIDVRVVRASDEPARAERP